MKKLIKNIVLFLVATGFVACNKSDDSGQVFTAKPYSEVTPGEVAQIEKFFEDFHMDIDADKNISFTERTANSSLASIKDEFKPQFKTINYDGYDFKVYYIPTQTGVNNDLRPCPLDSVFVSYHGLLLNKKAQYDVKNTFNENQTFDQRRSPVWFNLNNQDLRVGFKKMMSFLLPGNSMVDSSNNVLSFQNFGSQVIFLPSGLAYYGSGNGLISSYAPLIFNIKLMKIRRVDNDRDKVESVFEEFEIESDPVKFVNNPWISKNQDTDGDKFPDYFDQDDDNDGVLTFDEVVKTKNSDGTYVFWDYANIPTCEDNVKRHLSKKCSK
ncbi:FKBP-type peptidyl-prolyl cis-trans isomerase [Flavobacterium sp.]|uniref:FKBP-type peptidyl-prolyl cis-trans isomerase n=1 Tax=Flavobacterium sp. TaxID=239 RepID=UPI003D119FC9